MASAAAARGLLLGDEDCAFRFAVGCGLHGDDVGRANAEVMVNARREDRALHQRAENIGQQKIRDRFELVAGRGMSRDLQAKLAQVLHRTPHFGAAGAQFLGDAGSTDDHGCVVAQQAHDAAETRVGGTVRLDIHAGWRWANQLSVASSQ